MSQFDFGTIDPQVEDGTMLAEDLNSWRDAVHTTHMGTVRPSYIKPGMLWIDSSALPVFALKLFDGQSDITVFNFNNSTHVGGDNKKYDKTGGPLTGSATFSGDNLRILGDLSNVVQAKRLNVQTTTANSISVLGIIPSGTGNISGFTSSNGADPDNSGFGSLITWGNRVVLSSGKSGSGTVQPLAFDTSDVERARVTPAGAVLIGTTAPFSFDAAGHTQIASGTFPLAVRNTTAAAGKFWRVGPDSSGNNFAIFNQGSAGVYITDGGTSWTANSDERLKADLVPIAGAGLWDWFKTVRTENGRYKTDDEGKQRAFLIAQDWTVRPDVTTEQDDGMLGLASTNTLPYAYAVLKTAMERIEELEARVAALEG
jgi:hypothetical protein